MITQFTSQAFDQVRIYVNDQQVEHSLRNQFTDFPEIENGQWVRVTDFTVVTGIGRKLQNALLKAGFRTWAQIADATDLDKVQGIGPSKASALKAHAQTVDPKGTWKTRWGYLPVMKSPMKLYREWLENQINRQYGTISEQVETLADLDEAGHRIVIESPFGEGQLIERSVRWVQNNRPVIESPKQVSKPLTLGQWDHLGYDEQPRTHNLDLHRVVRIGVYANWDARLVAWTTGYIVDTDAVITAWVPALGLVKLGRFGHGALWFEHIDMQTGPTGEYRRNRSNWFQPDKQWKSQMLRSQADITELFILKPVSTPDATDWLWQWGSQIASFIKEYDREERIGVNVRPFYRSVERFDGTGFNEIEGERRTYRDMKFINIPDDEWYESPEAFTSETVAELADGQIEHVAGFQATWTAKTRRDWAGESIIARPVFKKRQHEDGTWSFYMKHQDSRASVRQRNWQKMNAKQIKAQYEYHQRMTGMIFKPSMRFDERPVVTPVTPELTWSAHVQERDELYLSHMPRPHAEVPKPTPELHYAARTSTSRYNRVIKFRM